MPGSRGSSDGDDIGSVPLDNLSHMYRLTFQGYKYCYQITLIIFINLSHKSTLPIDTKSDRQLSSIELYLGFPEALHHLASYISWIAAFITHLLHHVAHHARHHLRKRFAACRRKSMFLNPCSISGVSLVEGLCGLLLTPFFMFKLKEILLMHCGKESKTIHLFSM